MGQKRAISTALSKQLDKVFEVPSGGDEPPLQLTLSKKQGTKKSTARFQLEGEDAYEAVNEEPAFHPVYTERV